MGVRVNLDNKILNKSRRVYDYIENANHGVKFSDLMNNCQVRFSELKIILSFLKYINVIEKVHNYQRSTYLSANSVSYRIKHRY